MEQKPVLCVCASFNRTDAIADIIGVTAFPDQFRCYTDPTVELAAAKASGRKIVLVVLGPLGYHAIKFLCDDCGKQKEDRRVLWVHSCSAGLDWYRLDELKAEMDGVLLTNGKGGYNYMLGLHVLYSVLYFNRETARFQRSRREKKWDPFDTQEPRGLKVGIIGYGDIGRAAAKLIMPLEMDITGVKRSNVTEKVDEYGVHIVNGTAERDRVIRESDVVVNILPYTAETAGLFCADVFATMKRNAIYINIGRGGTQVEADLAHALKNNVIAGASLDVYEQEPLPLASPLWDIDDDKVLLTSHNACITDNSFRSTIALFSTYAESFLKDGTIDAYTPDISAGY